MFAAAKKVLSRAKRLAMTEKVVTIPEIAASDYTNTSRLIHSGPCIVKAVHVAAEADGCNVFVYDGVNDQGRLKAVLRPAVGESYTWQPGDGTDFDYGIYVKLEDPTDHVTVTFIPESRKAFI